MQKHNGGVILITKSFAAPSVGGCCLMQTWKLVLAIGYRRQRNTTTIS